MAAYDEHVGLIGASHPRQSLRRTFLLEGFLDREIEHGLSVSCIFGVDVGRCCEYRHGNMDPDEDVHLRPGHSG